ncbi:hypothetical protein U1P98_23110 [Lysinibacillus irui]|uniref:Uncharacterized protein n=1 Tax=Lysinibacillus irui TaxID=2998077 RepID=A0ABU5NSY6_9BACI|nr:hypothetical protein [Lysinibacillus irui]MEA0556446.1 hypothetical protein [Lysinibacillus irui]MEA0979173.1 hypothetical protein [Lysinibacillus irui]MEA1045327.1 hypothetical protein [Lysinibacillus irui]
MVARIVIDRTLQFLKDMVKKAVVTIDDQESILSFYSQEIVEDTVKTYVFLENGHGQVTNAKLVDAQGIELDQFITSIQPSEDGLMIVFTLSVKLKGELQI